MKSTQAAGCNSDILLKYRRTALGEQQYTFKNKSKKRDGQHDEKVLK